MLTLDLPYRNEDLDRFAIPEHIAAGNRPRLPSDVLTEPREPLVRLFRQCTETVAADRPSAKEIVALLEKMQKK